MPRLVPPRNGRARRPLLATVALVALPAALWAAPPLDRLVGSAGVPVLLCAGTDCAEGEGLLGELPAHMAPVGEADLGGECSECEPEYSEDFYSRENPADDPDGHLTTGDGSSLAADIEAAREHCSTYPVRWRIECLSSELDAAAERLPATGDSGRIRAQIKKAAAELEAIAVANADPAQEPVRLQVPSTGRVTSRPIRAVAASRIPSANAAAAAVVDTLATTLLRSAPSNAARRAAFVSAAQALDSTKILLRSA